MIKIFKIMIEMNNNDKCIVDKMQECFKINLVMENSIK